MKPTHERRRLSRLARLRLRLAVRLASILGVPVAVDQAYWR